MLEFLKKLTFLQIASLFFGFGLILYFYSLFNGFVADDNVYILSNPQIRNFDLRSFFLGSSYYSGDVTKLSGIYFKPLFTLITSALYNISGGNPFLIHLVQTLIHCANSLLVFLLFAKFFPKNLALFLGLVFLIHPGNVESVVYIADLQDVLFFLFGISALLVSLSKELNLKKITSIALLLLGSLLCKESGILFLPTIVLLSIIKFPQNRNIMLTVVAVVFLVYLLLRFAVAQVAINHQSIAPIMDASIQTRLMTLPKIIYSYILLFIFPKDLSWGQHWVVNSINFWNFYWPLIVISFSLASIFYLFLNQKYKEQKFTLLFFLSLIILGIGLHSQILIPLDFTFAERWFYFPAVGFLGLMGIALQNFSVHLKPKKLEKAIPILVVITLLILSSRTFIRTLNWKDDFTLSSHDIKVDPNSLALQNNLGFELIKLGQFDQAKIHLEKSVSLYSDHSSYNNLAFVYAKIGEQEKSLETYKKALNLGDHYLTYQNLIAELIRQNKLDQAKLELEQAFKKYPNNPKLYLLLSVSEYNLNNKDEAIRAAQKANYLSPGSANFILNKIQKKEPIAL